MQTIFSHIIQKRFSQVNEDVATDALAYVLESSEAARRGMTKLLRGIAPDLPNLYFRTQQTEGSIRPDMWGFGDADPRVFVENKFWAGLTDNQPVSYLEQLSTYPQPTVLLLIAPAAREHTLWRELRRRLAAGGVTGTERDAAAGVAFSMATDRGPIMALTSWAKVLSVLEHEAVDDPAARGDLVQLRSLCDAADSEAFTPVSNQELSDQRTPAFILQLNSVVQETVDTAVTENVVSVAGLRPQASWERIGRYMRLPADGGAGACFGIHLRLWKAHGTPLWLVFADTAWGRARECRSLIEPWAATKGALTLANGLELAIALNVPVGEEKGGVVRSLADGLKEVAVVLQDLPRRETPVTAEE